MPTLKEKEIWIVILSNQEKIDSKFLNLFGKSILYQSS